MQKAYPFSSIQGKEFDDSHCKVERRDSFHIVIYAAKLIIYLLIL